MTLPIKQPQKAPKPGIYNLPGTQDGEQAYIAYDDTGECAFAAGNKGFFELKDWLQRRGLRFASAAALFLLSGTLCLDALPEWGVRTAAKRFYATGTSDDIIWPRSPKHVRR